MFVNFGHTQKMIRGKQYKNAKGQTLVFNRTQTMGGAVGYYFVNPVTQFGEIYFKDEFTELPNPKEEGLEILAKAQARRQLKD